MGHPAKADHRHQHRMRVLKRATILNGISNSEISCAVRNMHKEGAELEVPVDVRIPEEFLLYVPSEGVAYVARLCWRSKARAGVSFAGTAPKPSWHYG